MLFATKNGQNYFYTINIKHMVYKLLNGIEKHVADNSEIRALNYN